MTNATTTTTVTDRQIRQLRTEAAEAGDMAQVKLCDDALRGNALALAECARVIADTEAQVDWVAWRYPTEAEIADGRAEEDMIRVGSAPTRDAAKRLLRGIGGQVQQGEDGQASDVEAQ